MANPLQVFEEGLAAADPIGTPLVADAKRLAPMLCMSLRAVRTADTLGRIPRPVKIGGRCLWVLGGEWGIRAWLEAGAPPRDVWEARQAASRK